MRLNSENSAGMSDEKGYSLVEIMVAISIAGIVISLAFAIYLFGQRYFVQWSNRTDLQNEVHTVVTSITEDLYQANQIVEINKDRLVLITNTGDTSDYDLNKGRLMKNDRTIFDETVQVADFNLVAKDADLNPLILTSGEETGKINFIDLAFSLTDGDDTLTTLRAVHLRKPSSWNIMQNR